jgi:hypothetical protein
MTTLRHAAARRTLDPMSMLAVRSGACAVARSLVLIPARRPT